MRKDQHHWFEVVHVALTNLGGSAELHEIHDEVARLKPKDELPQSWRALVRHHLELNSSDSEIFQGRRDVFHNVDGVGVGVWALRVQTSAVAAR